MTWADLLRNLDKIMINKVTHAVDATDTQQTPRWDSQSQQQIPLSLIKTEPIETNWLNSQSNRAGNRTSYPSSSGNPISNQTARFNGNCNYCRRFGHKEIDCRTKARENGSSGTENNSRAYNTNSNSNNTTNSNTRGWNNYSNRNFNQNRSVDPASNDNNRNNTNNDRNLRGSNQTRGLTSSNAIDATAVQGINAEFPFYTADNNVVEGISLGHASALLLTSYVQMKLFNQPEQTVLALMVVHLILLYLQQF